jgi:acyl transferase domain-containing protein/aryl carrier-like protein
MPKAIAVIGLACRVPGAIGEKQFLENIAQGIVSIKRFSRQELTLAGVPARTLDHPNFVPVCGYLEEADCFDAEFFGLSGREAALTDPHHRLLLECAWEGLEAAGHDPLRWPGRIGCFVGAGMTLYAGRRGDSYLTASLLADPSFVDEIVAPQISVANRNDYIATRIGYAMNFRGPCVNVQTACSTGLAAVHTAMTSLLAGDCDMAVAGAAAVHVPVKTGYIYEGGLLSPDGSCRAFDSDACGTVGGSGVGVVILRRLEEALADGDRIRAVIIGSAMNNDGNQKVSFLAPGVEGQIRVVSAALQRAKVDPRTIRYVEAHGTGTPLGDTIEVSSLSDAYRTWTLDRAFCALGSVKANIGHLDSAAGIIGLIKTVLIVEAGLIPKLVSFHRPNPKIALEKSPFWIPRNTIPWPMSSDVPRRAAVSSFGAGGTNVHMIVEEAPARVTAGSAGHRPEILALSARSPHRLAAQVAQHARHLACPDAAWADIAFTSTVGRHHFEFRSAIVAESTEEARSFCATDRAARVRVVPTAPRIVFGFPGQGGLDLAAAYSLYKEEYEFRKCFDECSQIYSCLQSSSLLDLLCAKPRERRLQAEAIQCLVLATSVALASVWNARGVMPAAVVGHSLGEFAAAHAAGVIDLETAIRLVEARGRFMRLHCPTGAMVAVNASLVTVQALLEGIEPRDLMVAAYNAPQEIVVTGSPASCDLLELTACKAHLPAARLDVTHAFHSPQLEPMFEPFRQVLATVKFRPALIPMVSTVTGDVADFTRPDYWIDQLRYPVKFRQAIETLGEHGETCFIEVGIGAALSRFVEATLASTARCWPSATQPNPVRRVADTTAGLYEMGFQIAWEGVYSGRKACRVALPTYPFERVRYWHGADHQLEPAPSTPQIWDLRWQKRDNHSSGSASRRDWLILCKRDDLAIALQRALRALGIQSEVKLGERNSVRAWSEEGGGASRGILWFYADTESPQTNCTERVLAGLMEVLALARDIASANVSDLEVAIVTCRGQAVPTVGDPLTSPTQAAIWSLLRAFRLELPNVRFRCVDGQDNPISAAEQLASELAFNSTDDEVAFRDSGRFVPVVVRVNDAPNEQVDVPVHGAGVYLVAGGFEGLGMCVAERLAKRGARDILLVGRREPSAYAQSRVASIRESGVVLRTLCANIATKNGIAVIERAIAETGRHLKGIVQAAGIVRDASVMRLDETSMAEVLAPKVSGTWNLDRISRRHEIDFFVAFSSIAALAGSPGQANYAAANGAMDAIVEARLCDGLPGLSIRWGPWADVGMSARQAERRQSGFGLEPMTVDCGLAVFERLLAGGCARPLVASMSRLAAAKLTNSRHPLVTFGSAVWSVQGPDSKNFGSTEPTRRALSQIPTRSALEAIVEEVAQLVGVDPAVLDPQRGFVDQGIDSVRGLQLRARLNSEFGVSLPAMAIFVHPTPQHLARVIDDKQLCGTRGAGEIPLRKSVR